MLLRTAWPFVSRLAPLHLVRCLAVLRAAWCALPWPTLVGACCDRTGRDMSANRFREPEAGACWLRRASCMAKAADVGQVRTRARPALRRVREGSVARRHVRRLARAHVRRRRVRAHPRTGVETYGPSEQCRAVGAIRAQRARHGLRTVPTVPAGWVGYSRSPKGASPPQSIASLSVRRACGMGRGTLCARALVCACVSFVCVRVRVRACAVNACTQCVCVRVRPCAGVCVVSAGVDVLVLGQWCKVCAMHCAL